MLGEDVDEPLPFVVTVDVVAVEPAAAVLAACWATRAEFRRGLRVEVPEWSEGGERERVVG